MTLRPRKGSVRFLCEYYEALEAAYKAQVPRYQE